MGCLRCTFCNFLKMLPIFMLESPNCPELHGNKLCSLKVLCYARFTLPAFSTLSLSSVSINSPAMRKIHAFPLLLPPLAPLYKNQPFVMSQSFSKKLKQSFFADGCNQRAKYSVFWRYIDFYVSIVVNCVRLPNWNKIGRAHV